MKRYYIGLVALLFATALFSQPFVVTPEGLRSKKDESKDFIVIGHREKTAEELYSIAKHYVMETVDEPFFSIKADKADTYIRYSLYTSELFSFRKMLLKLQVDASFDVEMSFKDGRIRYRIINLLMKFPSGADNTTFEFKRKKLDGWAFYDQKDKLYLENEKEKTERFFSDLLREFALYVRDYDKGVKSRSKSSSRVNNDDDW